MGQYYSDVHKIYRTVADEGSSVNWLDNGNFAGYDRTLRAVLDNSSARASVAPVYDFIDANLYRKEVHAFDIGTTKPTENTIGSWYIYGVPGAVVLNPVDLGSGTTIPSFDGGCLAKIEAEKSGSITMEQPIDYYTPLLGQDMTLAISVRKFSGQVKVEMFLCVDGFDTNGLTTQSQFAGTYRRYTKAVHVPLDTKTLSVKIKLSGLGSWSVGVSGASMIMSACTSVPYTESLADVVIPKGTTILFQGESCPSGYLSIADDGRYALISSGTAGIIENTDAGPKLTTEAGSDKHDHADSTIDCLEEPKTVEFETAAPIPEDCTSYELGMPYHHSTIDSWYPHSKPTAALSVNHTHKIKAVMDAAPKALKVKFCKKL